LSFRFDFNPCIVDAFVVTMPRRLGSSSVLNITDINSGKIISSAKLNLSPNFFISALFSPQNSSIICVLASSNNASDRFVEFFTLTKLTEKSPVVLKFPELILPEGVDPSPTVTGYLGTDVLVAAVGGSVLMWYLDNLTAPPKKLFSITAPNALGMDAVAAVTTDPKILTTKTVVVWDYSLTSSIYVIDLSSTNAPIQIDLRKYCGGDSNFAAAPRRAFFDAVYQRFYLILDSCKASAAPMLVWVETTAYPPTVESSTPKDMGPLAREVGNFQWLFQLN
jgi:hypothetical protein